MTDDKVTLGEVYRAVQAVDSRLAKSVEDREKAEHGFRNKLEAVNMKVAVIETRLTTIEAVPRAVNDATARWTGISAGLAAVGTLIWNWWHK